LTEAEAVPPAALPTSDYASDRTFADFPISSEILLGLTAMGWRTATPVQAATIDSALAGKDLVVRAKTGTGKTGAFCIPIVERIAAGEHRTRAIILTPTRELAIQVAQDCANIARFKDLRIAAIYGGVGFGPQEDALRAGSEVVVGTPGRLLDHLRRKNLDLSQVKFAVLDEADEMCSMGFLEDVRKILDQAGTERQNFLFSATVDDSIKGLVAKYLREPEEVFLSYDGDNVSSIQHVLYETSPDYHKARALLDLIERERPNSALIFCNTREDVSTVCTYLDRQGLGVEMISGDLPQKQRERVMARMKGAAVQFLVATDVAARGIDISDLSHVINYSLPEDAAVYLHRCGRTGRIGKSGIVLNLVGGQDFGTRRTLETVHRIAFEVRELPTPEESASLRGERITRLVKDAAGTMAYEGYLDLARALKDRPDADTLIAVALRAFLAWDRQRRLQAADESVEEGPGEGPGEARADDRRPPQGRRDDRGPRRDDRRRDDRGPRRDDRHGDGRRRDERGRDDRRRDDRRRDEPRRDGARRDEARRPEAAPERAPGAPEGAPAEGASAGPAPGDEARGGGEGRRRRRRRRGGGGGGGQGGGGGDTGGGAGGGEG
jgi:ATP-dependent RNA helicase DeaD